MGTPYTVGFTRNHTCYLQILYLWLYRYSVHGYGYGIQKADPWYTREKPYLYLPLLNQLIYLYQMITRIFPLFTLIPPADIFTLNDHQNFTLDHPYSTCKYIYTHHNHPYSPLFNQDIFVLTHYQNFTLIHPYPTYRQIYIESPPEYHPYAPLRNLQLYLH